MTVGQRPTIGPGSDQSKANTFGGGFDGPGLGLHANMNLEAFTIAIRFGCEVDFVHFRGLRPRLAGGKPW